MRFVNTILLVICLTFSTLCRAQESSIVIWIPATAGGINTKMALLLERYLGTMTSRPVNFQYVPGAGGRIAFEKFATIQDSNINLLMSNDKVPIMVYLAKNLPTSILSQIHPVAMLGESEYVISVASHLPVRSIQDLDRLGRKDLTFASVGQGSYGHFVQLHLQKQLRTQLIPVFYRGATQALTDLAGGHVDMHSGFVADVESWAQANRIRPISISGRETASMISDQVPDFYQQRISMPGGAFFAMHVNSSLDPVLRDSIQKMLQQIFDNPTMAQEWQQTLRTNRPFARPTEVQKWWIRKVDYYRSLSSDPAFQSMIEQK